MSASAPTPTDISPAPSSSKDEAPATPDSPEAREYRSDWNADEGKDASKQGKPGQADQAPAEKKTQAWPG